MSTDVTAWLGVPEDAEQQQLHSAIETELGYFASLPLDPWKPVGDNRKVGTKPALSGTETLTAPLKVSAKDYKGGIHACLRSFRVAYENREHMDYSEGSARWSGISEDRRAVKGEFPPVADCSAFATWGGWDGLLFLLKQAGDIFNGDRFEGGFTGTLVAHGEAVGVADTVPIDFVLCGGSEWVPQHVVVTVGGGRVISHGHQGDPGIYTIDDFERELGIVAVRRYIVRA